MAELAYAAVLETALCGFDSHPGYQFSVGRRQRVEPCRCDRPIVGSSPTDPTKSLSHEVTKMTKKLCVVCHKNPREVPDRERMGRPIKRVCRKCHALRLAGDLQRILDTKHPTKL